MNEPQHIFDWFQIVAGISALILPALLFMRPKLVIYLYLLILFNFSAPAYGVAQGVELFNIYGKGTGILPISLLNVFLIALSFTAALQWRGKNSMPYGLGTFLVAFDILYLAYASVGLATGVSLANVLSSFGVIQVVNMSLLIFILHRAMSTQADLKQLTRFIIVATAIRAAWGVFRFLFLGGDPANYYANYQEISVHLTFFDINDSFIAAMGGFLAAWELQRNKAKISLLWRNIYRITILLAFIVVVFSFRRTAWFGLLFTGLVFIPSQPRGQRLKYIVVISIVSLIAFGVVAAKRFQSKTHVSSVSSGFFSDLTKDKEGKEVGLEHGRFSELIAAFETIKNNPVLGVGPWGGYPTYGGIRLFMHSSIFHLWLKTGLPGLMLYLGFFVTFIRFAKRYRSKIVAENRGLFETGVAGFAFMLPNILFGTPTIEYRTMQLIGLALVLPYIAAGVHLGRGSHSNTVNTVSTEQSLNNAATPRQSNLN